MIYITTHDYVFLFLELLSQGTQILLMIYTPLFLILLQANKKMLDLFTYGSLMFPSIWERVVARSYTALPAVLTGYARMSVINEDYPVIIPSETGVCHGILYRNISEGDLTRIDLFEGREYRRVNTMISLLHLDQRCSANAEIYCLNPDYSSIVGSTLWNKEYFEKNGIEKFIQKYNL